MQSEWPSYCMEACLLCFWINRRSEVDKWGWEREEKDEQEEEEEDQCLWEGETCKSVVWLWPKHIDTAQVCIDLALSTDQTDIVEGYLGVDREHTALILLHNIQTYKYGNNAYTDKLLRCTYACWNRFCLLFIWTVIISSSLSCMTKNIHSPVMCSLSEVNEVRQIKYLIEIRPFQNEIPNLVNTF